LDLDIFGFFCVWRKKEMTIPKPTAEQITNYLNQQKQGRYAAYYGTFFDLHDRK